MVDQTDLRRSARGLRTKPEEQSLKKLLLKPRKCHLQQHRLRGWSGGHPALFQMIYLEITYAQKHQAKPFGVRWDPIQPPRSALDLKQLCG
jgi:hypothetical protein